MKNTECTIYIMTKNGCTQSYSKGKNGWTQTSSRGIVRPLSAEQLLSHILPPLATVSPGHLHVKVERKVNQVSATINIKNKQKKKKK